MKFKCLGLPILLSALLFLPGCHAEFNGELRLDDAPFTIVECRSGEVLGFSGVQFSDAKGRSLRVLANADGTANVGLFDPNATTGTNLGACGPLSTRAQNSRINSIVNLEGSVDLSCEAMGHKLSGKLEFKNCH